MDAILTDPTEAAAAVIERLLERGKLDDVGVERARRIKVGAREQLHGILVKLGLVDEMDVAEALADVLACRCSAATTSPTSR